MKNYEFVFPVHYSDSLIGRRGELQLLKESLFKKRMKNTILIGEAGCGKTAILEQFAYDMRNIFQIFELDIGSCVAGTSLRGQFEKKLIDFLNDIKNNPKIILFIDEIHMLYNAGGSDGAVDASNIIKSYLSRGEITIIGATTLEEYNKTIKNDKALMRRLSPIFIKPMSDNENLNVLKQFNENILEDELIDYIYEKSKNLGRVNPDISIEILDRCIAKKKFTGKNITKTDINKIINYMKE